MIERSNHGCSNRRYRTYAAVQELEGFAQHDPWRDHGRACREGCAGTGEARSGGSRGRHHGLCESGGRDRAEHRAPDRLARRHAGNSVGHDGQPLLLIRFADRGTRGSEDSRGRGGHLCRGWRGIDFLRAERSQQVHVERCLAGTEQAGNLLADAGDRGDGVEALQDRPRSAGPLRRAEPATRRCRARGRQDER